MIIKSTPFVYNMDVLVNPTIMAMSNAILHTVAYADVFDYPLTSGEIHRYLIGIHTSRETVEQFLRDVRLLTNVEGYYTLPGREMLAKIRRRRERISSQLWPQAISYGRIIAGLPFVHMVAVTGALAMNNVEKGADIDYLIVTEPDRLWFCRALVLLIGRLAALQGVSLCPNYLVSLRTLDFPDKTLYAAHEIAQMVPLAGLDVYDQIRERNGWVGRFLPNADSLPATPLISSPSVSHSLVRPVLEAVLRTTPFAHLERWEMHRKIRKLRREQGASPESVFSADYCKGHAHCHQARTQVALGERLNRLGRESLS
jgi:hypothetical protein